MGRLPTYSICGTIVLMWCAMMLILVYVPLEVDQCKKQFETLGWILCREGPDESKT